MSSAQHRRFEEYIATAPNTVVKLSYGRVHYKLFGSPNKERPLVVLIHGFSGEGAIFYPLAESLAKEGFQVLAPDLYGRGYSEAAPANVNNDDALFITQISELLLHVAPDTEYQSCRAVNLVGVSMGGAIVAAFSDRYPRLVKRVVCVCPAGLPMEVSGGAKFFMLNGVGELFMGLAGKKLLTKHLGNSYGTVDSEEAQKHLASVKARTEELVDKCPGYMRSLLSTGRYFPLGRLEHVYVGLGKREGLRRMLVWGNRDIVVPFDNHKKMNEIFKPHKYVELDKGGHIDMFVMPELIDTFHKEVASFLLDESDPGVATEPSVETDSAAQ